MTAKKCTKKRDARAKIVVLLINPIAFLKFSLPSPSSDLKVPTVCQGKYELERKSLSEDLMKNPIRLSEAVFCTCLINFII